MKIINKKFQNKAIIFDLTKDKVVYLNATKTAKQFGKEVKEWLKLKSTKEYVKALEIAVGGKNPHGILHTIQGGIPKQQGTWLHPKLTVFFARWLDIEFSIWCDVAIEEILEYLPKNDSIKVDYQYINSINQAKGK